MGSNTDETSDRIEILRRIGTGRRVVLKTEFVEKWEKEWMIIESTNLPLTDPHVVQVPAPGPAAAPAFPPSTTQLPGGQARVQVRPTGRPK